jgi:D-tyrosyl-tRNA(Tyr) deacylase
MFAALDRLTDADLSRETFIRGERHSVMQAINRQLAHYSCHLGQIVFLAKHLQSANWKSLTVPRGASATFNAEVAAGRKSQR